MFSVDQTFEWYEDAMVFCVFIFIFLFRNNCKKGQLEKNNFHHCSCKFFESLILKFI